MARPSTDTTMSPSRRPARCAGPRASISVTRAPAGAASPSALASRGSIAWKERPGAPRVTRPVRGQLAEHRAHVVDRDGEAEPLAVLHDGRVDADDPPLRVEERPAAVARVHRRVGLEELSPAGPRRPRAPARSGSRAARWARGRRGCRSRSPRSPTRTAPLEPSTATGRSRAPATWSSATSSSASRATTVGGEGRGRRRARRARRPRRR